MPSLEEMAKAHLLNVEREINSLKERKVAIDQDIERLQAYLNEGVQVLVPEESNTETPDTPETKSQSTISNQVF